MRIKQAPTKPAFTSVKFKDVKPGTIFRLAEAGTNKNWRFLKIRNPFNAQNTCEAVWIVQEGMSNEIVGQLCSIDANSFVIVVDAELTIGGDL